MNCEEVGRWIDPLLDGELDARNTTDVQAHLAVCPSCQRRYEVQQTLSSNIRGLGLAYQAPESLRRKIAVALEASVLEDSAAEDSGAEPAIAPREYSGRGVGGGRRPVGQPFIVRETAARGPRRRLSWLAWAGWPVAVAASTLLATVLLQQRALEANGVVAAHVRSLLADHLNDVVSTDRHTVKPWFAGKLDFSPPVPDLSAQGFELVGGRLDYLRDRPVAAVVYRKHGHVINVLSSPIGRDLGDLPHTKHVRGYTMRAWQQSGLDVVAVSDIDPLELARLELAYRATPQPAAEPSS
jgi:mycothiol system anti-sigma-R factor